jgi:deoxycytidine triphosphate deaminase
MSILAYDELVALVKDGCLEGVRDGAINGASIDVHLGGEFLIEAGYLCDRDFMSVVDLGKRESPSMIEHKLRQGDKLFMDPGEFLLANTQEIFHLPDDVSAQFLLKSSVARAGLSHLLATWADATWHSSTLTLELTNHLRYHKLCLEVGMPIGQMIFHRHARVPEHASYAQRGRYNNDQTTTAIKR